jgi:pimeloyl-ACP methyl ester carboxylesterase
MESGDDNEEVIVMSGADDLRAAPYPMPPTTEVEVPAPLGPDFRSAIDAANARVDALGLAELHTKNGTIRYLDVGEGAPVLLVHGMFGGSDAALRQLGPLVPAGFRIIAPSRFGYLGATLPVDATPARQAELFIDLLDSLRIARVAVLAVSAGSTAALRLATRHRRRVSALALVSPNAPGSHQDEKSMPGAVARMLLGSERLMWLLRRHYPARLARLMGIARYRALGGPDLARVDAELDGLFPVARRVNGVLFDAFRSNPAVNDCEPRRVIAPTLVVHARDDAVAPCRAAVGLSRRILGSRLLVEEHGGHLLLGQHPEVTAAVHALLLSTRDRPATSTPHRRVPRQVKRICPPAARS